MFREEKRILEMDEHEQGVVINALNDYRNNMLAEGLTTDIIDDLLIKVIDAPTRKEKRRGGNPLDFRFEPKGQTGFDDSRNRQNHPKSRGEAR